MDDKLFMDIPAINEREQGRWIAFFLDTEHSSLQVC